MRRWAWLASLVAFGWTSSANATTIEVGPTDDVEAAIAALQPGDELIIAGGTYTLTEHFGIDIAGTAAAPILIRAKDGEVPHFDRPAANQNIIDIDNAEYVTIRGLVFSGGSAGLRISGALELTIESCEIYGTADVALRANDTGVLYKGLHILNNHIHDTDGTGEGMYLGCNGNGCQIADSFIVGNYVHHTNQASVVQGDGIELKEGSYNNVIADNVIHDTNYPCILTYSTVGNGAPNVVERNALWSCGDHGIQSSADAIIRNNIILSAGSDGIAMQPHQSGAPANLVVVHNTIIKATNDAISLRGMVGSVTIANNAVYGQQGNAIFVNNGTAMLTLAGNVGEGGVSGAMGGYSMGVIASDMVSASYAGAPPMDVFPAPGGNLVAAGDTAHVIAEDFNGTPRGGVADVGAYAFDPNGNPGWTLGEEPKQGTGSTGAGGAGAGGAGSGGNGSGNGSGTGSGANSGSNGAGGAGNNGAPVDESGCGCRLAKPSSSHALWLLFAAALLATSRRRPRR